MKKRSDLNLLQYLQPGPTSPGDASPIETEQNKDAPDSSTADFQNSEEEITREQSETQALDAGNLSMIVDLAEVLSGIKRRKELRNDEIYQFYKNHFIPTKNRR